MGNLGGFVKGRLKEAKSIVCQTNYEKNLRNYASQTCFHQFRLAKGDMKQMCTERIEH